MIYKISLIIFFLINTINLNANYTKKTEIINGNKVIYSVSSKKELHDTIFKLGKNQDTEVIYFFSYNCPSCYAFKDYFEQAKDFITKKESIRLEKVPLFLEENTVNYYNAKLFFWKKILRFDKNFDHIIYDLIHKENISIQSEMDLNLLLKNYALINDSEIEDSNNIKKLNYRMNKSKEIAKNIKVLNTPTIIIHKNGKRYLINATDAETPYNMLVSIIYILEYK
jgi:protein-disulfide isomerase